MIWVKDHLVPTPLPWAGTPSTRLLKAPSNLALNTSREGASTAPLGNLFQCLTTLIVKKFFLISNLNLPSFSLKPLPLALLSLHAHVKSHAPAFCRPLQVQESHYKVTPEPSLLQAEQPQLSQPFLIQECSSPLIIFVALLWT